MIVMKNYLIKTDTAQSAVLGYEGENNARTLRIKTTDSLTRFASVNLLIGTLDCGAMTVVSIRNYKQLEMVISEEMLGEAGMNKCQLVMKNADGNIILKTNQFFMYVRYSNVADRVYITTEEAIREAVAALIDDGTLTALTIEAKTLTTELLDDEAVTTEKIADGAVTLEKLGPDVVIPVIDDTFEESGKAADAAAVGEALDDLSKAISLTNEAIDRERNVVKTKMIPDNMTRTIDGLDISYLGGRICIDGSNPSYAVVLEADSDMDTDTIHYRQSNGSGLFEDVANHPIAVGAGFYKLVYKLVEGSVTRDGETYTSNDDFGRKNVVTAFLWKANPAAGSDYLIKTTVSKDIELEAGEIGLQTLYIYKNCTFDNAVFELYLENVVQELPYYWMREIETSISTIQDNIMNASSEGSSTICFITDCHWAANKKYSPAIVKKLFSRCNINYFVNGGDLLNARYNNKATVYAELKNCINAFRECGKPMITLYGNHDRNTNGQSDSSLHLSQSEHVGLVFKSFLPHPNIKRLTNDYSAFYWEDDIYRYVCLYWWRESQTRNLPYADMFDTDKKVVVFTHGYLFALAEDPENDTIDCPWIANDLEPYKNKIRCVIQGHTHRDGIRHLWGTVPVIVIDCDTMNKFSVAGTISEQSVAVITIDTDVIKVVKVGKGEDFTVTASSPDWRQENYNEDENAAL